MVRFGESPHWGAGNCEYEWYRWDELNEPNEPSAAVRYLAYVNDNRGEESLVNITSPDVTAAFTRGQESLGQRDIDSSPEAIAQAVTASIETHPEQGRVGISVGVIGWEVFGLKPGDADFGWLGLYLDELAKGGAIRASELGFYGAQTEQAPPAAVQMPESLSPQAFEAAIRALRRNGRSARR